MPDEQREIVGKVNVTKLRTLLKDLPKNYPKDVRLDMNVGMAGVVIFEQALKAKELPCFGCVLAHYLALPETNDSGNGYHYHHLTGQTYFAKLLGIDDDFDLGFLLGLLEGEGESCATLAFGPYADAYNENPKDMFGEYKTTATLETVIETWERYADRIEELQNKGG